MEKSVAIEKRTLGNTGLSVTILGLGAAELGFHQDDPNQVAQILNGVLDAGLNFIDTADCYADSEEKIGNFLSARRNDFILATKCGHRVGESQTEDWTGQIVREGIERSLRRLKTDHVDILHLHSCSAEQLRHDDLIDALVGCKSKGKTRFIGYSGDADAAETAIAMNVFDVLETSVSFADQQAIATYLPRAQAAGMGITAKRSVANGCWRDPSEMSPFYTNYAKPYIDRLKIMNFTPEFLGFDGSWIELAIRFTAFTPGVHSAIVGAKSLDHILEDIKIVERGPLPPDIYQAIRDLWKKHDDGSWKGQI